MRWGSGTRGLRALGKGETERDFDQLFELQILLYSGFPPSFSHLVHDSTQETRTKFLQQAINDIAAAVPLPAQRPNQY